MLFDAVLTPLLNGQEPILRPRGKPGHGQVLPKPYCKHASGLKDVAISLLFATRYFKDSRT